MAVDNFVQVTNVAANAVNAQAITLPNVTPGNLILVGCNCTQDFSQGGEDFTIADAQGNTYTSLTNFSNASYVFRVFGATAQSGGSLVITVTSTPLRNLANFQIVAAEYTAMKLRDGTGGVSGGSGPGSLPTAVAALPKDLIILVAMATAGSPGTATTITPPNYTVRLAADTLGGAHCHVVWADQLATSPGTYGGETWSGLGFGTNPSLAVIPWGRSLGSDGKSS